jgi:hypothetical protein
VSTRDRLHKLVDELSEQEANDAPQSIAQRHEGAAFRDARRGRRTGHRRR